MTAFEVVADTFLDECQIEIVEDDSLPLVVDERNPFHFEINFRDGIWYCIALFQCREDEDKYVTISKAYSSELVGALSYFYNGEDEEEPELDEKDELLVNRCETYHNFTNS